MALLGTFDAKERNTRSFVAKEKNDLIGYSINTLYDEPSGLRDLDPFGNHKHPCASHTGVYIGFRGHLNPVNQKLHFKLPSNGVELSIVTETGGGGWVGL